MQTNSDDCRQVFFSGQINICLIFKVILIYFYLHDRTIRLTAWKVSVFWVFLCPYFPAFELNMERYSVSYLIQSECDKIRTRKTPNLTLITQWLLTLMKVGVNSFMMVLKLNVVNKKSMCENLTLEITWEKNCKRQDSNLTYFLHIAYLTYPALKKKLLLRTLKESLSLRTQRGPY